MSNCGSSKDLDMQVNIEAGRILTTLDRTIHKMKLAVALPQLLANNCESLRCHLSDQEMALISSYTRHFELNNDAKETSTKDAKSGEKKMDKKRRDNEDICRTIQILYSKSVPFCDLEISPGAASFLNALYQLRHCLQLRLSESPLSKRSRDRKLRLAWHRNGKANEDSDSLMAKLNQQREEEGLLLAKKDIIIQKHESKIASVLENFKESFKQTTDGYEREIAVELENSQVRQNRLTCEFNESQTTLTNLLDQHRKEEKSLAASRYQVETELKLLLEKFDENIGEKQMQIEKITALLEKEMNEMALLQVKFDVQKVEFERLMAEKQAACQRELEEKMFIFVCNRAARRIQRYWRAYRERKIAKKKRKGKKGKGSGAKKSSPDQLSGNPL